jgi:hypothetical protein
MTLIGDFSNEFCQATDDSYCVKLGVAITQLSHDNTIGAAIIQSKKVRSQTNMLKQQRSNFYDKKNG